MCFSGSRWFRQVLQLYLYNVRIIIVIEVVGQSPDVTEGNQ